MGTHFFSHEAGVSTYACAHSYSRIEYILIGTDTESHMGMFNLIVQHNQTIPNTNLLVTPLLRSL